MLPVHQDRGGTECGGEVHKGVLNTDALYCISFRIHLSTAAPQLCFTAGAIYSLLSTL